ncbi:MAG: hypothetical protein ABJF88_18870 [Rhodothermales bacterium]
MAPSPSDPRRTRSRLFVIAFVVLVIALSVWATTLIISGRQDAEFQEQLEELREEGR